MPAGRVLTYGSIADDRWSRVVVWYMLNRTAFGRHVYATGDDPDAARLAGINTDRTLIAVYALAGLICAHRRLGADRPHRRASARSAGQTANLDSITAVVIGGTSRCSAAAARSSARCSARSSWACSATAWRSPGSTLLWQEFAVGVLIIVAVTHRPVDQEGLGMSATATTDTDPRGRGAWSSATAASSALDHADFELHAATRSSRSSATTAPASRR